MTSIIIFRSLFWISNLVKFIHSEKATKLSKYHPLWIWQIVILTPLSNWIRLVCLWQLSFFSLWSFLMFINSKLGRIRQTNQILGGWFLKRLWPTQNIGALSNLYLQLTLLVVPSPKSCFESTTDFHSDQSLSQRWHIS